MTNDWNGVVGYAKTHPTYDGQSWDGWCLGFVTRAGGFTDHDPTAHAAYGRSRIYTPAHLPIGSVPTGWLLWWDYTGADGVNYGHVGYAAPGGLVLMASSFITQAIHPDLGYAPRGTYTSRTGHTYLGASPDLAGQSLTGVHPITTTRTYTVQAGDTLTSIAARYSTTWQQLATVNRLTDPNALQVGEHLTVP